MPVQSWTDHFTVRDQAIAEIEAAGLHLYEADSAGLPGDQLLHAHDYEIHAYVLAGAIEVRDGETGQVHAVGPGGKVVVPSGVPHCGLHGGYVGVLGLTIDPATYAPPAAMQPA